MGPILSVSVRYSMRFLHLTRVLHGSARPRSPQGTGCWLPVSQGTSPVAGQCWHPRKTADFLGECLARYSSKNAQCWVQVGPAIYAAWCKDMYDRAAC